MKLTVYIPGTDHHSGHVAAKQGSVAFGLVKSKSGSKSTFDFTAEGRDGHSVTPASGTDINNGTGATITINN